jgi:hypothetical protein
VSPKDEIWFLRVCHHISYAVYPSAILQVVLWDVSGCAGGRGVCISGAVTESGSTSCVEQNFNNVGPFIIRPFIFTVALIQHEQCEGKGRPDTRLE